MNHDDAHDPFDEIIRNSEIDDRLARLSARADRTRSAQPRTEPVTTTPKRRGAARGTRRTALGLSAVSTLGLAGWLYQSAHATPATDLASVAVESAPSTSSAPASATPTTAAASSSTSSTAGGSTSTTAAMGTGTFTGAAATTKWGPVQVQITVAGGKITSVDVLSYPSSDTKSQSINATAIPRLVQSTLTAQSASVNSVSGATYTSGAYKTSLQSAIDAARAAS